MVASARSPGSMPACSALSRSRYENSRGCRLEVMSSGRHEYFSRDPAVKAATGFSSWRDFDEKHLVLLSVITSGVGFLITFIGFYLLYSQFGAVYYVVYAVLSIITTSLVVGVLIFREPFNAYQAAALVLAILAIALFSYGQAIAK